jgi:hypothetical protein
MPFETHYPLWMQTGPSGGGDPLPGPLADQLIEALAAHLGQSAAPVAPPVLADSSQGPGAVLVSLTGEGLPDAWRSPLVVRAIGAEAEAAVASAAAARVLPCGAPRLVAASVAVPDELGSSMVVLSVPEGRDVMDLINDEPGAAGDRLRELGRLHASLHAVDAAQVPGLPVLDFAAVLAGLPPELSAERAWLEANRPAGAALAVCHGGHTPMVVRQVPDDDRLLVRNWSAAVAAEASYDLARTMLSFWIAPFFAATRSERRGMTMIRDGLANLYRTAYAESTTVEDARLNYWQAFHAVVGIADAAARPGVLPEDVGPNLRKRFIRLSRKR